MLQHLKTKKKKKFLGSLYLFLSLLQQKKKEEKKTKIRKVIGYNHRRCGRSFFFPGFFFPLLHWKQTKKKKWWCADSVRLARETVHSNDKAHITPFSFFLFLSRFMQARRQNYLKADVCTSKAIVGKGEKKKRREITSTHKQVERNPYTVVSFLSYTAVTGYKKKKATKKRKESLRFPAAVSHKKKRTGFR